MLGVAAEPEALQKNASALLAIGWLLFVIGGGLLTKFLFAFDTTIESSGERVQNIGLVADWLAGILIGSCSLIAGLICLGFDSVLRSDRR